MKLVASTAATCDVKNETQSAAAISDAVGTRHRRARGRVRIISLVPSITELLFALGLGSVLVGRTGFCVHPRAQVRSIAKVGGTKDVHVDKIAALEPSHVILNIDENTREIADQLAALVPHVIVTHPQSPTDNPPLYRLLGYIFSREQEAAQLVAAFNDAWQRRLEISGVGQRVLYLIWRAPWMTVSRDTYISRCLAAFGWDTLPAEATLRYPTISLAAYLEEVDRVFLSSEPYPFRAQHCAELRALGFAQVEIIDGEMTSWYGNRAIAGMHYLADLAHAQRPSRAAVGAIETPCISVCKLDTTAGTCIGCGRTGEEIAAWTSLSAAQRRAVLATLPRRLEQTKGVH